ncbi:hypothetical protein [Acinetobacter baumannii]|uniref:hypothetical protein n=1 Tax=Acinetobacter baumannii TaxID=470 RepID=UPI0007110623|nr:hypothetical protein [Acinetobacter baumannii]EKT8141378.1 hypothetical protein [Acinetobacter baumannii]EKU7084738.1 hypothetical protein [Acinetobacter baumannii]EKV1039756.1 hypothetical protein [Acinetobacter baumannii]EKV1043483.1 hypothetical protein [Acinetobacter baumannii]EKV1918601.1 hypothetical protein [Acinetobacter baumannii]
MSELIKVLDGGDFRDRWNELCIKLEDYENINCDNYEQELHDLFEYHSFVFDESKHEYWEIE